VTKRRGRRRKQLLDDLRKREDTRNWKKGLARTLCRTEFGRFIYLSSDRQRNEWVR